MRLFRSILSLTLAALVLMASSSFYLATHSCSGRVNKVAFLEVADGCGHVKMPPCHQKLMKKGCCEDEVIAHEGQDLKYESKLNFQPSLFVTDIAFTPALIAEIIPTQPTAFQYFDYDSPLQSTDRTVTLCTFLI